MKTSCEINGRIDTKGHFVPTKRMPLPPGPAKATIVALDASRKGKSSSGKKPARLSESDLEKRRQGMQVLLSKIDAIQCPPVPNDGKTVDEILYGARR